MEPIWLPLKLTRLLLELCRILLERRLLFGALLAPSGANPAPLSGVDLALFGAEKRLLLELFRLLLERGLFYGALLLKSRLVFLFGALLAPLERRFPLEWQLYLGAALAPSMGAELAPSWS